MNVEHDGPAAGERRRPDIQLEHVLALPAVVPVLKEHLLLAMPVVQALRTIGSVDERGVLPVPGNGRLGGQPAIFPTGVLTVGNALEGEDIAGHEATHFAVFRMGHRGGWRRTKRRLLLVNSGLDAVGGVSRTRHRSGHPGARRKLQCIATTQYKGIPGFRFRHCGFPLRSRRQLRLVVLESGRALRISGLASKSCLGTPKYYRASTTI